MKALLFLMIPAISFASKAKIELIDYDGETKNFTFYENEEFNKINLKLPAEILCGASFSKNNSGKNTVVFGCARVNANKKKKDYSFLAETSVLCDGPPFSYSASTVYFDNSIKKARFTVSCFN